MRPLIMLLMLLALGACAAVPEAPPAPPAGPGAAVPESPGSPALPSSPSAASAPVQVSLEEPGLAVSLRGDGALRVGRGAEVEEWRVPVEAAEKVVTSFRASGLFGPAAKPAESGGALRLGMAEGDVWQVRAPKTPDRKLMDLAGRLRSLVPGEEGTGPDEAWIAGTLLYEDLEGGTWKVRVAPDRDFVLATAPEGIPAGTKVRATGRPASADTVGLHMAGPYYEVMTLRPTAAASGGKD